MSFTRLTAAAVFLMVSVQLPIEAQELRCIPAPTDSQTLLAERYAPTLFFAAEEQHFPSIPYFTAFDGLDNDGDDLVDLADLDEIAPLVDHPEASDPVSDFDVLNTAYLTLDLDQRLIRTAVFYQVREITRAERRDFWDAIRGDENLRNQVDRYPGSVRDTLSITAIEYFFYYLLNESREASPDLVQVSTVLIPSDAASPIPFQAVIGTAGGPTALGNVHFRFRSQSETDPAESRLLVEQGGHAMTPDVGREGAYQHGIDVNWHASYAWGLRDFRMLADTDRYAPFMTSVGRRLRVGPAVEPVAPGVRGPRYSLIPVSTIDCLQHYLDSDVAPVPMDSVVAQVEALGDRIDWRVEFQGWQGLSAADTSAAILRMGEWAPRRRLVSGGTYFDSAPLIGEDHQIHSWHLVVGPDTVGVSIPALMNSRLVDELRITSCPIICVTGLYSLSVGGSGAARSDSGPGAAFEFLYSLGVTRPARLALVAQVGARYGVDGTSPIAGVALQGPLDRYASWYAGILSEDSSLEVFSLRGGTSIRYIPMGVHQLRLELGLRSTLESGSLDDWRLEARFAFVR